MNIKIMEGFAEEANVAISGCAVVLNEMFLKYEQHTSLETVESVSPGQVALPILEFTPRRIHLKSNAIKNTFCEARFIVYSKKPDSDKPCSRFIFAEKCRSREDMLKDMLPAIRDAYFDKTGDQTIVDLLSALGGLKSDKVSYFYNPVTGEGEVTYCIAIIHEFGKENDPYCVLTAYLSISVGK